MQIIKMNSRHHEHYAECYDDNDRYTGHITEGGFMPYYDDSLGENLLYSYDDMRKIVEYIKNILKKD